MSTDPVRIAELLGIDFSDQQLAAITAPPEPGVIIAGAGSGKTTVMAARVVWLVAIGALRPEQILGLTFTRKAAAELSSRVRTALQTAQVLSTEGEDTAGEQVVMTYDAFAARLVSEHGLRIGVESDPVMVTGATRFRLAARVVRAAKDPLPQVRRLKPQTVVERVLQLDAQLTSHLLSPDQVRAHATDWRRAFAEAPTNRYGNVYKDVETAQARLEERLDLLVLVEQYQQLKRRLGVVEFADQMAIAAELVQRSPEVAELVRAEFRCVLLDEYQDTSAAQAMLLAGLFSGPDRAHGRGHPVTAVGDPFQAIYGWRGAAASNILAFADTFPRADGSPARRFELTVNRRSGTTILDVANSLAAPLRGQFDPDAAPAELVAPDQAGPGAVQVATYDTFDDEVAAVADQVLAVHDGRTGARPRWSQIAVLTRRNADIARIYTELVGRGIPAEIVGLGGLLELPEVADVVAILTLLDDVTANPELVRVLSGPRWRIGARDLALLGRRARELAGRREPTGDTDALVGALDDAVAGVDPTELISLLDALDSPGGGDYSAAARERFALLAAELTELRGHVTEPALDLVRRVVATIGLDVELQATVEFVRTGRRDQLAAFLDAVADYVDVDGDTSLTGLLAWLAAERSDGVGLEQATPTEADSVKLLTVHRAKGLEWDTVLLPALVADTFPSDRVTDNWVRAAGVVPAELRGDATAIPQLTDGSYQAMKAYHEALKAEARRAEDRLAYVAATRAKRLLIGSGHHWRAGLQKAKQVSEYLLPLLAEGHRQGLVRQIAAVPPADAVNPLDVAIRPVPWPAELDDEAQLRRDEAAQLVGAARERFTRTGNYDDPDADPTTLDVAELLAGWDADIDRLLLEARTARPQLRVATLPNRISVTALLRAERDPQGYAAQLVRPMPRPPSRSAELGTRFHQWVEQRLGATALVDPVDLLEPTSEQDPGPDTEQELVALCEAFESGRFSRRIPLALELAFTLWLEGRAVRGRIDAVFEAGPDDGLGDGVWLLVVDWKTSSRDAADPLQLALYRLAVAELHGLAPEQVAAAFHHVRTDRLEVVTDLPGRAALEELLRAGPDGAGTGADTD